ncbi:hypothetical protein B0H19DRAFT_1270650 [Mycena capillaripes]|nr:hypothetical protein B0H19DRAFT_1270650 [Mycena capillaripes]
MRGGCVWQAGASRDFEGRGSERCGGVQIYAKDSKFRVQVSERALCVEASALALPFLSRANANESRLREHVGDERACLYEVARTESRFYFILPFSRHPFHTDAHRLLNPGQNDGTPSASYDNGGSGAYGPPTGGEDKEDLSRPMASRSCILCSVSARRHATSGGSGRRPPQHAQREGQRGRHDPVPVPRNLDIPVRSLPTPTDPTHVSPVSPVNIPQFEDDERRRAEREHARFKAGSVILTPTNRANNGHVSPIPSQRRNLPRPARRPGSST